MTLKTVKDKRETEKEVGVGIHIVQKFMLSYERFISLVKLCS